MLFMRQYHKTQPSLFTICIFNDWMILLFICSSLIFISSFIPSLFSLLSLWCVCMYVYIFILTGLFFCYFTFYLVHFQLSLFVLLFYFLFMFFHLSGNFPFLYSFVFSFKYFLHTFINFVCFLLFYCFKLFFIHFQFSLFAPLFVCFDILFIFVYFLHHTLLSFNYLFNSVFCSFFHLFFLCVFYVPFVARLTEPDTFSEQTDHVALLLIGYG